MELRRTSLELSLKPFERLDEEHFATVARRIYRQWLPLIERGEAVQTMLWTADGSEILEYTGDLDAPLEWARYIGGANPRQHVPNDPEGRALHSRWYLYREHPPRWTWRWLARLVQVLRQVGREVCGREARVGTTFDPGPEFALSPFKYERHNEICLSGTMGATSFVCCYGRLHAEARAYAGFPDGIPEGLPFGTFLGRQSQHFLRDLGFDFLWLSNGFGFGQETWGLTGPLFDGETFDGRRANECRELILEFWRLFRAECPDYRLEVRGTNLATGIDLAGDGVPWDELNRGGFGQEAPPNSPWAALDGDFGLELAGYLSRIAELPGDGYPFRYYTHDPWWLNSPWLDRYGREPHDIYLPLSVCRVDQTGGVATPNAVNLLTVDDSYGQTPDQVPREVLPHLASALDHAPDEPGPLVWVYPFADLHAATFRPDPPLGEVMYGDWLLRSAINNGLPLNSVISSRYLPAALAAAPRCLEASVLLAPVPAAGAVWDEPLRAWIAAGGRCLLYGPTRDAAPFWRQALGLELAAPLSGEVEMAWGDGPDDVGGDYPTRLWHRELTSAGGLEEIARTAWATYRQDGTPRAAAVDLAHGAGRIVWVRGTSSNSYGRGVRLARPDDPATCFSGDLLLRFGLARLGLTVGFAKREAAQRNPVVALARRDGALWLSGYSPNSLVTVRLGLPAGAPLPLGAEVWVEPGPTGCTSAFTPPRAWHREVRVCVEQATAGELSCVEQHSGEIGVRRRFLVRGLRDATVRFFPADERPVRFLQDPRYPFMIGNELHARPVSDRRGRFLELGPVSGSLLISW
ncbi:MAG: hypothetical protein IT204_07085 [Fimbriimonadaceae bacterium]|nr:hypothetical protein [Fimbriimonadaceae bacterium]